MKKNILGLQKIVQSMIIICYSVQVTQLSFNSLEFYMCISLSLSLYIYIYPSIFFTHTHSAVHPALCTTLLAFLVAFRLL